MAGSGCNPCDQEYGKSYKPSHQQNQFGGCNSIDATCVNYTGVPLVCLGEDFTNKNIEEVIQAINSKVCTVIGDWADFNYHCLSDDYTITSPSEFVDAITTEFCSLRESYTDFVDSTYPTAIQNLQTQINTIKNPGLTLCTYSGVVPSDNITSIFTKISNKICEIDGRLDLSSVTWNNCYVVPTPPTTLPQAFQLLSDQICQAATTGSSVSLPTFNNQGSCLSVQGTADTLVNTVTAIKTRLCQSPVFDIDSAPWGCVPNPATGTGTNLQTAFNTVLSKVNSLSTTNPTFDGDYFITSYNSPGDPCSGTFVTVDPSIIGADRLVAASPTDNSPATLIEKLVPQGSITIDDTTNPGQVTIINTATDQLVKASSSDPAAGYLDEKVNGANNSTKGISISTTFNAGTNEVDFLPDLDLVQHVTWLLNGIQSNPTLYALWCNLNCGCGPCDGSTTTTTIPPSGQLRLYIINQATDDPINMKIGLVQNSPTVGFMSTVIGVNQNSNFISGYYNLTTPSVPKTVNLTLNNPDFGTKNYDINVSVTQGIGGPVIPGTTSYSTTTLNNYTNTSFSIGSLSTDIVIQVIVSNVIIP